MAITPYSLQAISYGYLSGADLATWCSTQLLIAQLNVRPNILQRAVNTAIAEVKSKLSNVYDLTQELSKQDSVVPIIGLTVGAGIITGATILSPGSNLIEAPTITVTGSPGTGADITAQISDTVVSGVELLSRGRGYKQPPIVTFIGGTPTRPATGVATIDSWGHIAAIVVTDSGSGYKTPPGIILTPALGGEFAIAIPLMDYGEVTGLTIVDGGTGYVSPVVTVTGGSISDPREPKLVKIITLFAIRNALGSNQNISDKMMEDFSAADQEIQDLRAGLDNLPLYEAIKSIRTEAKLVKDKFSQLG